MADLLEPQTAPAAGVRATTGSNLGHLTMELEVSKEAVPIVRTIASAHLTLWGLPGLVDRTALVVSELLTNVLRHARPVQRTGVKHATLTLTRLPGVLSICVRDFDPTLPQHAQADDEAEDGRGLHLVTAFADDFGWSPVTNGKDVWASFLISADEASDSTQERR